MRIRFLTVSVVLGSVFASDLRAEDKFNEYSGTLCQPVNANHDSAEYDQFGIHNISTSASLTVECPLRTTYVVASSVDGVIGAFAEVYDRNTAADVTCTLRAVAANGTVQWQDTQHSSASGPTNIFLSFADQNQPASLWWVMRCTLPPAQAAGQFSYVTAVVMRTRPLP